MHQDAPYFIILPCLTPHDFTCDMWAESGQKSIDKT